MEKSDVANHILLSQASTDLLRSSNSGQMYPCAASNFVDSAPIHSSFRGGDDLGTAPSSIGLQFADAYLHLSNRANDALPTPDSSPAEVEGCTVTIGHVVIAPEDVAVCSYSSRCAPPMSNIVPGLKEERPQTDEQAADYLAS